MRTKFYCDEMRSYCKPNDESKLKWYRDLDEDGYGDSSSFEYLLEPVEGYVSLKGDCDDSNPSLQAGG